ncbi:hypothetical protein C343_04921 [Cryptococcus neoformans C23]|nr:hypothetical protein C347_04967 [Cryptococcus neoformans var. grubii AD2-60a]OWZ41759.1 hypothetical protein C343_04921 [Cryptococcus neoformans var. grubii C23]OXG36081.1 hypothetical protein C360_02683 [Cryptococcus neoformans var. grubii Bt15]
MPTSDTPVHPLIQERYPRFEGAVGDIDGTHIPIKVPALLADENCNRKGVVTTNFLAICDFNFKFVYLLPGFSGSVHDSRVFREAKLHFGLTCPAGCYYLGDLGYPNCDAVLTPYRGILYHTEAWRRTGNKIILRKPICVLQALPQDFLLMGVGNLWVDLEELGNGLDITRPPPDLRQLVVAHLYHTNQSLEDANYGFIPLEDRPSRVPAFNLSAFSFLLMSSFLFLPSISGVPLIKSLAVQRPCDQQFPAVLGNYSLSYLERS